MRVIICDDNLQDIQTYSSIIQKILKEEAVDAELLQYDNPRKLLFDLDENKDFSQVIFLDINMPELSGMETARLLRDQGYEGEIVFLTYSKSHMLGAFDVRAFNYIVKFETPESKVRKILKEAIQRVSDKDQEYILFTGIGEHRNIALSSIKYFEVNGKIITVHYGTKSFEFISTIGKIENMLYLKGFLRVHRSYLVATASIGAFSYGDLLLFDGTSIPVGRKYYEKLKETMEKASLLHKQIR